MIKVTGETMKSEIANAIQKYNGAIVYSYGDDIPLGTDGYHVYRCAPVEEFCDFVIQDLKEKTKDSSLSMVVIYTNESDKENIKILEKCCTECECNGYVVIVVLMTK